MQSAGQRLGPQAFGCKARQHNNQRVDRRPGAASPSAAAFRLTPCLMGIPPSARLPPNFHHERGR
jgi:hypothetical protein